MAKKRANGEGSIFRRRNGSWRAQLSLNSKRLTFGSKNREECQAWLRKMQNQVDQGFTYKVSQMTVESFITEWFSTARNALREKIAPQYDRLIQTRIIPHLGKILLVNLHLDRVDRFYADLGNEKVGKRSIRYVHSVLHRAMEKAVKMNYILRNPAHGATLPRIQHFEMQVLDESQVLQFTIAAKDSRNEALYLLAITTGMRQGELFGLKWLDIEWNKEIIHIRRQVQRVPKRGLIFNEPKTHAGRRTIRLGQNVLQALRGHKERQIVEKAVAGNYWQDLDLVFPSTRGTPMDQSNLLKDYYNTLKRAGLPRIRFHDLRHTAASLMISHDIPINVVSKILGHSKPSVTLDIYAHVYTGRQDEAAQLMDDLVTSIPVKIPIQSHNLNELESESVAPGCTTSK
jgi:integrase